MIRRQLGIRRRLLAAIVAAVAVALAVGVGAFNLLLRRDLAASARSLARAQAQAELSTVQVVGGRLVAPEARDRGTTALLWVFAGTTEVEAPPATAAVEAAAHTLSSGPERSLKVEDRVLLYAIPIVDGVRYGTVVSAVSLVPYESTERAALIGSALLAVSMLAAVALLARWMLSRALQPVATMTENAAAWSDHDLSRRFAVGEPYDELTRLGATLDTLLERISASLRHEQRFTAELSHELRTPLARAKGETEFALRRTRTPDDYRTALAAVGRSLDEMAATVEGLLAAARQEVTTTEANDIRDPVDRAVTTARSEHPSIAVRLRAPDRPLLVAIEPDLITSMLRPLLENACRYGRSSVVIAIRHAGGGCVCVDIVDDGPGIEGDETGRIFEPGFRGRAGTAAGRGAGLGLPLARRLAGSAGGDVSIRPAGAGGGFTLSLPLAANDSRP